MKITDKKKLLLETSLINESKYSPKIPIIDWIEEKRDAVTVNIDQIKFEDMDLWGFNKEADKLCHDSGKFFSIEGISIETNFGQKNSWNQPIINQPEIGYLGIIAKKFDGVLHFLIQAKIEPGNINFVQLSPTLQATKSNYLRVHKGKAPLYLDYFKQKQKHTILLDQLQSEQGARFLRKRNRNIIILVEEEVKVEENFCWLTLGQIKELLKHDNLINMDTRTVISGIFYGLESKLSRDELRLVYSNRSDQGKAFLASALDETRALHDLPEIVSWITELKSHYELDVRRIGLSKLTEWQQDEYEIFHKAKKYFTVMAVRAEITNREVTSWTQPIVKSAQEGIIAFIVKKINGIYHFLVQAKVEIGNLDILELAPTVQCLTGNFRDNIAPLFLNYVLNASSDKVIYSSKQSEEGGRFYREQNLNIIVEADETIGVNVPDNFCWITLNQIQQFIQFNNYLNIQSRSLISAINFL